jgi:HAD superfamily hydrolase (TIGR01450 family)
MTEHKRTLADIKAFLTDMDGTLYVSDRLIPGAPEFIALLRERSYPFLFLTNNSSARAVTYRDQLRRLGIPAESEEILTSGAATAHYLLKETSHRRIFLLGTPALREEFIEAGFVLADEGAVDAVVLGFDKTLTYERLKRACLLVTDDAPYYATHPDYTCITDEGLIPDTGSFIEAIKSVNGRVPHIIGKPQPEIVQAALARLGHPAEATAMVGDQLDTDIAMANRSGLYGILVFTGETSKRDAAKNRIVTPDLLCSSVARLAERLGAL